MTKEEIDIINSMRHVVARSIRLKRSIDVDDVMQNLFVRILNNYEKFGSLPNEREKRFYAFRACKNMLIDMYRRREVRYRNARFVSVFYNVVENKNSALLQTNENAFEQLEIKEELKTVLQTLKKYSCHHELLLTFDGYKAREIAALKNISINTVLGRIRYARNFLNDNLYGQKN